MADLTAPIIDTPQKTSKVIENVKRELIRSSNDKLKVFNPTDKNFNSSWDGFSYEVKAKSEAVVLRYIANNYIKHMISQLIGEENTKRVDKENAIRLKSGQKPLGHQEREVFDLKKNDDNLRKKYMPQVYKGLVESYGQDTTVPEKSAVSDARPVDERLMEDIDKVTEQTEPEVKVEPPIKIDTKEFDDEEADFDIPDSGETQIKKDELRKETAE